MSAPAWPGAEKAWTFLAPMEGVTHPAFRALIARRPGVGVVCTEFVRIAATGIGERHLARQVVRADGAALSVQVMGNHLEHMAEATAIVAAAVLTSAARSMFTIDRRAGSPPGTPSTRAMREGSSRVRADPKGPSSSESSATFGYRSSRFAFKQRSTTWMSPFGNPGRNDASGAGSASSTRANVSPTFSPTKGETPERSS